MTSTEPRHRILVPELTLTRALAPRGPALVEGRRDRNRHERVNGNGTIPPSKATTDRAALFQRRFLGESKKGQSWETEPRRGTGRRPWEIRGSEQESQAPVTPPAPAEN